MLAARGGDVDRAVEDVAELAHVAGPVVRRQGRRRFAAEGDGGRGGIAFAREVEEALDEGRDVVSPALAERRHGDGHDRETEVEIFAELAALDLVAQVALGGGDDASVGAEHLVAADAAELARLEDAQELGCTSSGSSPTSSRKTRAAARELEGALARRDGAGEGAALVPEELALDQAVAHGAAVHDHERAVLARALLMQGARQARPCRCRSRLR